MSRASPIITSFNSGEFSPLLAGRVDLKYYAAACKKLHNFVPSVQGPARRRHGTYFAGEVKDSSKMTWLGKFVFSQSQSYLLEFGHQYVRFYANHGIVGGGSPVELVTPFTESSMVNLDGSFSLRFEQSGDVLYVVDGSHQPQKIMRTGASSFTISALSLVDGPFEDISPDSAVTVYAGSASGSITLTASANIFVANHVGGLFKMEQKEVDSTPQWEVGKTITAGNKRRSDGKNYVALNSSTTGSIKPTHSSGAKYDGDSGVQWQFHDSGYGYLAITAVASGNSATATVTSGALPDGCVGAGNATNRWAFGSFSAANGWPNGVAFFRERLCFSKGRRIFASVSGDFENFASVDDAGLIVADMSARIDITSSRADNITWMSAQKSALLVGTGGSELAVSENDRSKAFGPGNIKSDKQSEYGSSGVASVAVGHGVLFVQGCNNILRDMVVAESVDERWASADVTVLAEHIVKSGIVDMAYQQSPDQVLWCVTSDGGLSGFTISRDQDVRGWHRHTIGGHSNLHKTDKAVVESVETIQSSDGNDELWMIVRRMINGSMKRYIEYVTPSRNKDADAPHLGVFSDSSLSLVNSVSTTLTPGGGADVAGESGVSFISGSSVFSSTDVGQYIHKDYKLTSDSGDVSWHMAVAKITSYISGTSVVADVLLPFDNVDVVPSGGWRKTVSTISGLSHLEGETVAIRVDGAAGTDKVVVSGVVEIDSPASVIHVGLPYASVLTTMPLEAGSNDGSAQGKIKRISNCTIRFNESMGAEYGNEYGEMDSLPSVEADGHMGLSPELFTGNVTVAWPSGYGTDASVTIVQRLPLPCSVVAVMPKITTNN